MPFDYSLEWPKSEPQRVLDVIKEVGISSRSMDYPEGDKELALVLAEVGREVMRQIDDLNDGRGPNVTALRKVRVIYKSQISAANRA